MSFQIHTLGFFIGLNAKYMKNKILIALIATIILLIPQVSNAQEKASVSSASIQTANVTENAGYNSRVKILQGYLESQNSPLAPYASEFVAQADKYNLDWRFVAAISGLESSFGQAIPANSYNGWGWGVYGDNVTRFSSWTDGIDTISQGLREKYMDLWGKKDVYEIGSVYAASPTWAVRVNHIMDNISDYALGDTKNTLSLSF